MRFSRHFRQVKPNKFGYTPVYYDEQKEKRDLRNYDIERELGKREAPEFDAEDFRERFANKMRDSRRPASKYSIEKTGNISGNTIKIVLLLAIGGIIVYWQFFM